MRSARIQCFYVFTLLLCPLAINAITEKEWSTVIDVSNFQEALVERMVKQFLLIVKGIDVKVTQENLKGTIDLFDSSLIDMKVGNKTKHIPPSPDDQILQLLKDVRKQWDIIKPPIEASISNSNPSQSDIDIVMKNELALLKKCVYVAAAYVTTAQRMNAKTPGAQLDTAGKQRMYIQKMSKEALGLNLGLIASPDYLRTTITDFQDAHSGLLRGVDFLGLPQTINICQLWQMRHVTYYWENFKPELQRVVDTFGTEDKALQDQQEEAIQEIAILNLDLLYEMNKAVALYLSPKTEEECKPVLTEKMWIYLLNEGGMKGTVAQRVARLFFQVAFDIAEEGRSLSEMRSLLRADIISGGISLRSMIEGSEKKGIAAPPTQIIAKDLTEVWADWQEFEKTVEEELAKETMSKYTLENLALLSEHMLYLTNAAVNDAVAAALKEQPQIPSNLINVAGRQRTRLQEMSKESVLYSMFLSMGVTEQAIRNKKLVEKTKKQFEDAHYDLLHGNQLLEKTTNACILQQMWNIWENFYIFRKHIIEVVSGNDSEESLLDQKRVLVQIATETEEHVSAMHKAVGWYANGVDYCPEFKVSLYEWEYKIKTVGHAYMLQQKVMEQSFLSLKGVQRNETYFNLAVTDFKDTFYKLKFGSKGHPPTSPCSNCEGGVNAIADMVNEAWFAAVHLFSELGIDEKLLHRRLAAPVGDSNAKSTGPETPIQLAIRILPIDHHVEVLMDGMLDMYLAEASFQNQEGEEEAVKQKQAILATAGTMARMAVLVQRICKDAVMLSLGGDSEYRASLIKKLADDLESYVATGNSIRVNNAWVAFSDHVYAMKKAAEEAHITIPQIKDMEHLADELSYLLESSVANQITVDFLVPLPFNGSHPVGETLRMAILVAQDIINEQQLLLPGYSVQSAFFDDQCRGDHTVREVLETMAGNNQFIAIGGMGCNDVCAQVSVVASSMRTPSIGYECAADYLTDDVQFHDFYRLGTVTLYAKVILVQLAKQYQWKEIKFVYHEAFQRDLKKYTGFFNQHGIKFTVTPLTGNFDEAVTIFEYLNENKYRVVYFIGDEYTYRTMVCAEIATETKKGLTWVSEGVHSEAWWTRDDANLLNEHPECTADRIAEHMQGAINIKGMGAPNPYDEKAMSTELTCFKGFTPKTFFELVQTHVQQGYPIGEKGTEVENPFNSVLNYGADGTCALVLAVSHMLLEKGKTVDEVRILDESSYEEIQKYIRYEMSFEGASGPVSFTGNDNPGTLGVYQLIGQEDILVGTVGWNDAKSMDIDQNLMDIFNGGIRNDSWTEADMDPPPPEAYFPWDVIKVLARVLPIGVPCFLAYLNSIPGFDTFVARSLGKQSTAV